MEANRKSLSADCIFNVSLREWRARHLASKTAAQPEEKFPTETRRPLRRAQMKRVVHLRATGEFPDGRAPQAG